MTMPEEYLALARKRAAQVSLLHAQVESFGYDFRDWISPYTKGAHQRRGIALVLQDWASTDELANGFEPDIQLHGRARGLRTNARLEVLLQTVLGLSLSEAYATNAFPFIKSGAMSARLRLSEVVETVRQFTAEELRLAAPSVVLALGLIPYQALRRVGISCVRLPHPAARIGGIRVHENAWRVALATAGVAVRTHGPQ